MKRKTSKYINRGVTEAQAAVVDGDYGRAIEIHEDVLRLLVDRDPTTAAWFSNEMFGPLLVEALDHAVGLLHSSRYPAMLDLVRTLVPRFAESGGGEEYLDGLATMERVATERILYSRSSSRPLDAFVCCAAADETALATPLIAALQELGISVEPSAFLSASFDGSFGDRLDRCDFMILLVSPELCANGAILAAIEPRLDRYGAEVGRVIPVWGDILRSDVAAASAPLERVLALHSHERDVESLARDVADLLRPDLASGVLNKAFYSSALAGETLSHAFTTFDHPVRHERLDDELIARIRLIRAAFLDGNRQTMRSWIGAFSRELDPYAAVAEWQGIARVFQEAKVLQRDIRANDTASAAARTDYVTNFVPGLGDQPDGGEAISKAFLEFAQLSDDRLALYVWWALQPLIVDNVDPGGMPWGFLAIMAMLNQSEPLITVDDDFVSDVADGGSVDYEIRVRRIDSEEDVADAVVDLDQGQPWAKEWDVFISHASEDKERVVRPLSDALAVYGVDVWYDDFTLKPGASLRQSLDQGIEESEFGIVVISQRFLNKEWTMYELEALRRRQGKSDGRLLTVWHGVSREDAPSWAQRLDPSSDLLAGTASPTSLAREVLDLVRPDLARALGAREGHRAMRDHPEGETSQIMLSEIAPGPRYRDRLPEPLVERVRLIRAMLFEGHPHSMGYWLEGFLRDLNPEHEIAHWERIAALNREAMLAIPAVLPELASDVDARDIFRMVLMVDHQEALLPHLRHEYPDEALKLVLHLISAPTVIDLFDPD